MHEASIVEALLNQIEGYAKEHNAKSVSKIYVIIGEVSGVEPHLLKVSFDAFKQSTIAKEGELIIEFQKPVIYCFDCQKEFELDKFRMKCPDCNGFRVKLTKGDELILKTLELIT